MRFLLTLSLLILCCGASLVAQEEWPLFTSDVDRFSVRFPTKDVEINLSDTARDSLHSSNNYMARHTVEGRSYGVIALTSRIYGLSFDNLPPMYLDTLIYRLLFYEAERLDYQQRMVPFKGDSIIEVRGRLVSPGQSGRIAYRAQVHIMGRRLFYVYGLGPEIILHDREMSRFFSSFMIHPKPNLVPVWVRFARKGVPFSIDFPTSEVWKDTFKSKREKFTWHRYRLDAPNVFFTVVEGRMNVSLDRNKKEREAFDKSMREYALQGSGGTILKMSAVSIPGFKGVEYRGSMSNGVTRRPCVFVCRTYWRGKRMFVLSVGFFNDDVDENAVARFFDSFTVTD